MIETHGALLVGELFAGRFRIEAQLGEGGMGLVYLARHQLLGRRVALKVLGASADPNAEARFRREAQAASQIQHPSVVSIFDFGMAEDGRLYLAMEYLHGPTLADLIAREGPLPVPRALEILAQVSDALEAAHSAGVVHRDLKPTNIMLLEGAGEDGQDLVKVLDFGLAKFLDANHTALTAQGTVFGTAEYIAPERCLDQTGDARSDLYSLGVIAFELLVGRVPFRGRLVETLRAHLGEQPPRPSEAASRDAISPELDALVLRCLAKRPEERFQRAGELAAELRRIRGGASPDELEAADSTLIERERRFPLREPDPLAALDTTAVPDTDRLGPAPGLELSAPLALLELAWCLWRLRLAGADLSGEVAALAIALQVALAAEAARQAGSSEAVDAPLVTLDLHAAALRERLARLRALAIEAGLDELVARARL